MKLLRRALPVLVATAVATGLVPGTAQAAETTPRPADGVLQIEGRGFGHGRGMSQWGAYGAASAGLGWTKILDFYYPGTTRKNVGDTPIRVWISRDGNGDVHVEPTRGLTVRSGGTSTALPSGAQFDAWRLVPSGSGVALQRQDAGTWHPYPVTVTSGAAFTTSSEDLLRLVLPNGNRQETRGELRAVLDGTVLRTVAVMGMESYLRGVVPAEMPASWPRDAVSAQAVAARTYAARLRADNASRTYDTCDTTACQVYAGTTTYGADGTVVKRHENLLSDAAIADTAGVVLHFTNSRGVEQVVFSEFSAANGGWAAAGTSAHPYQVEKQDWYDGRIPSSAHAWTTTANVTALERAYPRIGHLESVTVDARTGRGELGGRVQRLTLRGSLGAVQITGDEARRALGLKSNWFRITNTTGPFSDVPVGHNFHDEIAWLAEHGIAKGVGGGVFDTRSPVQRQHMAAFLFRLGGDAPYYVPPETARYVDVPVGHPYFTEISWLADKGVAFGVGNGRFDTTSPVQRDQMAAFLHRLSGEAHTAPGTSPFPDVRTDWGLYESVTWLAGTGITEGYADGSFRPREPVQRQHMAAFLYRYSHR